MPHPPIASLLRHRLPDGEAFFTPRGARLDVAKVGREVAEYFATGIELKKGQVVFDVGANVGLFALQAARHTDGELSLYCFEPIPEIYRALRTNFERHPILRRTRHRLFNCGLTANEERRAVQFYYFKNIPCDSTYDIEAKRRDFEDAFETFARRTCNQIERALPGPMGRFLGRAARVVVADLPKGPIGRYLSDRVTGMETVECPLSTLASIVEEEAVPRIDLLKIDVEGAELDVLLGMHEAGWKKIRQIVLEGHDQNGRLRDLKELLEARGMTIGHIGKPEDTQALGLTNFMLSATRR